MNEKRSTTLKQLSRLSKSTTLSLLFLAVAGSIVLFALIKDNYSTRIGKSSEQTIASEVGEPADNASSASQQNNKQSQDNMLLYLIEEEKLAHDVYTVMYEKYGSRVFENILNSEQNHQDKVLSLLKNRNLEDPRSREIGKFNNTELQDLYNQLIEQGNKSISEAMKVSKAIEEKDIADIDKQLASATDTDIIETLDSLRTGSENHLRAFNRQIGKY